MRRVRFGLGIGAALLAALVAASAAPAADVFFPSASPPATQITREFSLKEAARRGLIKLTPKGGIEGDQVAVELQHKKVSGPITVTLHVEFTVKKRVPEEARQGIRDELPTYEQKTADELNRGHYKTASGDPIKFKVDYKFRNPDETPRYNHHQILIVDPLVDLDQPDPDFRDSVADLGTPNKDGASQEGTFSSLSLSQPGILSHELLHLAGLDDRYHDVYRVKGKDYPLPESDPSKAQLAEFARSHKPPLPPPPAGDVVSTNLPGTKRCDIMGTGANLSCRKLSKRDLKIVNSRAGVQVVANPGDLLLNKDASKQNYGIGFRTTVFAAPGSTTVARGIAVYCIDHSRTIPFEGGFDVLGPASEVPGYEPLAKLLALSGTMQQSLDEEVPGMLAAVWNITDGSPLATSGSADEARALMTQAGVTEDSVPGGLPDMTDPNADSEDTAAVDGNTVVPTLDSPETKLPPTASIQFGGLYPKRLHAGRRVFADLLVSVIGDADRLSMTLQRKRGHRWRRLRSLRARKIRPGSTVLSLKLGRLAAGSDRLVVTVSKSGIKQASARVGFKVRG
jgi:hypothetical protein